MSVWIRQGAVGDLTREAAEGLRATARLYADYGEDVFVTSKRDGQHLPHSHHYTGNAWDQRPGSVPLSAHRAELGANFTIIDHGANPHRHIEYDPPGGVE